jgi:hypothetical protein
MLPGPCTPVLGILHLQPLGVLCVDVIHNHVDVLADILVVSIAGGVLHPEHPHDLHKGHVHDIQWRMVTVVVRPIAP